MQNKRKIQEDIVSKRLAIDKEKLKLQQLKVNFSLYEFGCNVLKTFQHLNCKKGILHNQISAGMKMCTDVSYKVSIYKIIYFIYIPIINNINNVEQKKSARDLWLMNGTSAGAAQAQDVIQQTKALQSNIHRQVLQTLRYLYVQVSSSP